MLFRGRTGRFGELYFLRFLPGFFYYLELNVY